MPRGSRKLQVSFAGGEMSPEMFSRQDDQRFRSGAARLRNMIVHPRGSVSRRPGFGLVRETKDSNYRARLLEFKYSIDDTYSVEMGRADVDGREIGYFRFHTEGGTLLHALPREYVIAETVTAINAGTDAWTVSMSAMGGTTHGFETGDPIVFTMAAVATAGLAFNATFNRIDLTAHGFLDGEAVMFRSSGVLPPEVEGARIYNVIVIDADHFQISRGRGGQAVDFSVGSPAGPHSVAHLPRGEGPTYLDPNATYYAINNSASSIKIATSKSNALAGTAIEWDPAGGAGTLFSAASVKVHYDYRNGSTAFFDSAGSPYYCIRTPWGTPRSQFLRLNDHLDHAPSSALEYWVRMPGSTSEVTFDVGTDTVTWVSGAHGLSDGDIITFTTTGSMPVEIVAGTPYYLRDSTATTFKLASSPTGPALDLTVVPSGTHTAFANGIYEVPHLYAEDAMFEITTAQSGDVMSIAHRDRPFAELRRLGATHWVVETVLFNAQVDPPRGLAVVPTPGEGDRPVQVDPALDRIFFARQAFYLEGDQVTCTDVETTGGTSYVPDGNYVIEQVGLLSTQTYITLKGVEDGALVNITTAFSDMAATARIRSTLPFVEDEETYVVTALDPNGEESAASDEVTLTSNLLVTDSFNTLTWSAVTGAQRYRVYKKINGLFGYMGEVDAPETTFVDDNIQPDLSITPPIEDEGLYNVNFVEDFIIADDYVVIPDHGLEAGAPVLFINDDPASTGPPTGINSNQTYYVINPGDDDFQLSETPDGATPVSMSGTHTGRTLALTGQFPSAVGYFEQRRVVGGSHIRPQDFWLTASGTETDLTYSIPTRDADRIQNRLAARERSQIRHAIPAGHLILLTSAAEYRITPLNSEALTPTSVSARAPTQIGSRQVAPAVVNNAILFAAARGGHIREMGFSDTVGDYITGDLSLRAAHLFDDKNLSQITYQRAPQPTVWVVSTGGTLVSVTYIPEEGIAGWHEHDVDGLVESCIAVAEGDEDRVYIVANRDGTRYIERMGSQYTVDIDDVFYVDSGVTYDDPLVATTTVFAPHLANQAVIYLADGVEGSGTVSAAGILTLPSAANVVHVGLAYTGELHTIPLGLQVDEAAGSGRHANINKVWVRTYESGGFQVGPNLGSLVDSPSPEAGLLATEMVEVLIDGEWKLDGQLYITQSGALPLSIAGLTYEVGLGA